MQLKANQVPTSIGLSGNLSISGKIIRVFEKKTGTTRDINWAFQNIIIQDDTGEMSVSIRNRPEDFKASDVDRQITISSTETKHGQLGVKVEQESYNDKQGKAQTVIKVVVTKSAQMKFADEPAEETKAKDEAVEPAKAEPKIEIDMEALRKDTIVLTLGIWKEVLKEELDVTSPLYPQLMVAIIEATQKNADTLFIQKCKQ
jgi:hypothetical protein